MYEYKHLTIDEDDGSVYYLGYKLKLTKSEYDIVCSIANSADGVRSGEFTDSSGKIKNKAIIQNSAVHICNINRKSRDIGNRKLIVCEDGKYYFNEFM